MGRYRIIVVSALVLCLVAFAAIAAMTTARGDESSAAALPTACENLVDATMLLAEHGSAAGVQMSGGDPFSGDAQTRSADTLQHLLDACDAELATLSN
jgi:hypothetical protein